MHINSNGRAGSICRLGPFRSHETPIGVNIPPKHPFYHSKTQASLSNIKPSATFFPKLLSLSDPPQNPSNSKDNIHQNTNPPQTNPPPCRHQPQVPLPSPSPPPYLPTHKANPQPPPPYRPNPTNPRLHRPNHGHVPQMDPLAPRRPPRLGHLLQAVPGPPPAARRRHGPRPRRPAPALLAHDGRRRGGALAVSRVAPGPAHQRDPPVAADPGGGGQGSRRRGQGRDCDWEVFEGGSWGEVRERWVGVGRRG